MNLVGELRQFLRAGTTFLVALCALVNDLRALLPRILKLLETAVDGVAPPKPDTPHFVSKEQIAMSLFRIKFGLGATKASDTAIRKATIEKVETATGNSIGTETIDLAADATELSYDAEDTQTLRISLVDVDGSGNPSTPSATYEYQVIDDIPPAQPDGVISVLDKEQL